jgi:hypothetical protein
MLDDISNIDGEIDSLEKRILQLKTRRNACTPLCRLPTELVRRILQLVQFAPDNRTDPFTFRWVWREVDAKWVRVLRVCSWLRGIAMGAPELWTFVDLDAYSDVRLLEKDAARAANRGFTLWSDKRHISTQVMRWLEDQLPAVKRAYFILGSGARDSEIMATLSHCDFALSSLDLSFIEVYAIGPTFLGPTRDRITHLSLSSVWIDYLRPFPSLTHLSLSSLQTHMAYLDFADLFSNTPQLEELYLTRIVLTGHADLDSVKAYPIPQHNLPALRIVRVKLSAAWYLYALLQMLPPPKDQMMISLDDQSDHGDHARANAGIIEKISL